MKQRQIGSTALHVSEISFGGAAIGGLYRECTTQSAIEAMQAAWNSGARMYDTAPFYGAGLSERRTGDFIREHGPDETVISTKVGRLLRPVPAAEAEGNGYVKALPFAVDYEYSYDAIMRSVEMSYARLSLNRIDILYVHDIGVYTHGIEKNTRHFRDFCSSGVKALQELKSAGIIRGWGLGVNEVQICLDIMAEADMDCILLAGRYTLLDRSAEQKLLPLCQARKTSLVIGGVFNSGILATGPGPDAHFDYAPASHEVLTKVKALQNLADEYHIPLAAAALQFPLRNPNVASVLIGTAKASSFQRNMEMMAIAVPEEFYTRAAAFTMS